MQKEEIALSARTLDLSIPLLSFRSRGIFILSIVWSEYQVKKADKKHL